MKYILGALMLVLLVVQMPLASTAYQKAQQCDDSLVQQLSDNLAKAHPDLDVVDCSFANFYAKELKHRVGLD